MVFILSDTRNIYISQNMMFIGIFMVYLFIGIFTARLFIRDFHGIFVRPVSTCSVDTIL